MAANATPFAEQAPALCAGSGSSAVASSLQSKPRRPHLLTLAQPPIPERVRRFILDAIDSVAELEALLLLRETAGQAWTADAAGARLYVSRTVAAYSLAALADRKLLKETADGFTYEPDSPRLAEEVTALAMAYSRSLVAITQLIHGKPGPDVQDFARAFHLRRRT